MNPISLPDMSFPERLARIRKERQLTQQELADRVGVHVIQVRRYEAGSSQPTLDVIRRIALALGVSADMLIFDEYEAREEIRDKELMAYFARADRLEPAERALIKMFLDNMLARRELEEMKVAARKKPDAA